MWVMARSLRFGRGGAGQGGRAQVEEAEQVSWALGCAHGLPGACHRSL